MSTVHVHVAAGTHTGCVRSSNEDGFGATGLTISAIDGMVHGETSVGGPFLAVVADGLGGHPYGERASELAVRDVISSSADTPDELALAVISANESVYRAMEADRELRGMGTTIAALLVHDRGIGVVNVGDSAVFELDQDRLWQLTEDDTPAGPDRLPGVPSSIVTQTLGGASRFSAVRPHLHSDEITEARRFLLCTDGLTNYVPLLETRDALIGADTARAVERLIDSALAAGAPDNVTVIVVDARWDHSGT